MNNPVDSFPAMAAMARILTLKDATQNFTTCDDLTRITISENDERIFQRFTDLVHPKHRAEAVKAAAFISGIVADTEAMDKAKERMRKVMDIEAELAKTPKAWL